jgi:Ca2+-transporting ATPase
LFINIAITIIQELKTTSALEALKQMTAPICRVLRDGIEKKIPSNQLVVGDMVYLDDGCVIPADVRLFDCAALKIDESSLTGESVPVEKNSDIKLDAKTLLADRINMAYSSTIVTNGKGYGIVINVGKHTEVGKIAQLLDDTEEEEIPLKRKLNSVCK